MGNFELISFADDDALARAGAEEWLKELERANRSGVGPVARRLWAEGARRFFVAAADLAKAHGDILPLVHFFWGDERCVPPTDPESNFALANELLLVPLAVPGRQIHRVRGEEAPEVAAGEAERELRQVAPSEAGGQPVLDLVFLGLGEDGHVASLFPGEAAEVMASRAVYRPVTSVKPPPRRITLGYPAIAASQQVWVLASGPGKAAALRASLSPEGQTPLARVLRLRSHTRIFTDISG